MDNNNIVIMIIIIDINKNNTTPSHINDSTYDRFQGMYATIIYEDKIQTSQILWPCLWINQRVKNYMKRRGQRSDAGVWQIPLNEIPL